MDAILILIATFAIPAYFLIAGARHKPPKPWEAPSPRSGLRHSTAQHDPALDRHYELLTELERLNDRDEIHEHYHDHYHQHDHHAPAPVPCGHCRASNHPYAPTCVACGAPIY